MNAIHWHTVNVHQQNNHKNKENFFEKKQNRNQILGRVDSIVYILLIGIITLTNASVLSARCGQLIWKELIEKEYEIITTCS